MAACSAPELERAEKCARFGDGQRADFGDGPARDAHGACFRAQARAIAIRAGGVAAIAAEKYAHVQLVFFALEPGEETVHAGKARAVSPSMMALRCSAVSCAERHVERNAARAREAFQFLPQRAVARLGPGLDHAFIDRLAAVGNHQVDVEIDGVAESLAARAGAVRIVERKQARLRLLVHQAAGLALEALVEDHALAACGAWLAPVDGR